MNSPSYIAGAFHESQIRDLRHVIAQLQSLDLSSPLEAIETVVGIIRRTYEIATEPPPPDPENARGAAAKWQSLGESMDTHLADVRKVRGQLDESVWGNDPGDGSGEGSGDAARRSLDTFATRSSTITPAAGQVSKSLRTFADSMTTARKRHDDAFNDLSAKASLSQVPAWPGDWPGYAKELVQAAVHGVNELIGSYTDANTATTTAAAAMRSALDGIQLPDHISGSMGAVSSVNEWSGGKAKSQSGDGVGPLREGVLERADSRIANMSDADKQAMQQILNSAANDQQRAWIMAAVASGADINTLRNFANRIHDMTAQQLAQLDPTVFAAQDKWRYWDGKDEDWRGAFTQPDGTTCGSSSLVMAKMINDPVYALKIMTGYDATTGQNSDDRGDGGAAVNERFRNEAFAMHDRTNTLWPEALGTSPWGAAEQMSSGSGIPGTQYQLHVADPADLGGEFERIASTVHSGQVVPLYVGPGTIPQHVVLVVAAQGDALTVYEPGTGKTYTVSKTEFCNSQPKAGLGNWGEYWGAVLPS